MSWAVRLSAEEPSVGPAVYRRLLDDGSAAATAGNYQLCQECSATAEKVVPAKRDEVAKQRVALLVRQLAAGDAAGVLRVLERDRNSIPSATRLAVAELARDVAKALGKDRRHRRAKGNPNRGRVRPEAGRAVEETALLWLRLNARPSRDKLRRCQDFVRAFSQERQRQ